MDWNAEYYKYVPDNCDSMKISREFLLALIAYIEPQLYRNCNEYQNEVQRRRFNRWGDFNVTIKTNLINDVHGFVPLVNNNVSKEGFRIFKNHQPTEVLKKIRNIGNNINDLQN